MTSAGIAISSIKNEVLANSVIIYEYASKKVNLVEGRIRIMEKQLRRGRKIREGRQVLTGKG